MQAGVLYVVREAVGDEVIIRGMAVDFSPNLPAGKAAEEDLAMIGFNIYHKCVRGKPVYSGIRKFKRKKVF